ncbi:MAG: DMT family transporter [Pseudomonadota bacterium]
MSHILPDGSQNEASSRPGQAALWMLGAIASFSTMAVSGRNLYEDHDTFEIMLFRSIIGIGIVLFVARLAGTLHEVRTRHFRTHLVRNIFHFSGQNLWFFAVAVAPLAQVIALEFTSPLWVTLLAPLFLSERLTRIRACAALIGFIGVIIVAQPDLANLDPGLLAALAAALCFAVTAIFTKLLTRTDGTTGILFWLTVIQAVFGLVAVFWDGRVAFPTAETLPWLLAVAVAGLTAHFCLTTALRLAPAMIVMPMDFLRLPALALIGLVAYNEPLTLLIVFGSALILCGNFLNLWTENRKKTQTKAL